VLGDVGHPEAVRIVSVELTPDEVRRRGQVRDTPELRASAEALDTCPRHEHLDRAVAHGDAESHGELSVDAPCPIRLARITVDAGDDIAQPGMAYGSRRRRPSTPVVVTRL
jgi:hypothetical protein